jgi:hypothetical protein
MTTSAAQNGHSQSPQRNHPAIPADHLTLDPPVNHALHAAGQQAPSGAEDHDESSRTGGTILVW